MRQVACRILYKWHWQIIAVQLCFLAFTEFYLYSVGRTMSETIGYDFKATGAGVLLGLFLASPLVILVFGFILGWPRTISNLASEKYCVYCGYLRTHSQSQKCSECGACPFDGRQFRNRAFRGQAISAFIAIVVTFGSWVGSELWILRDERAFIADVDARLKIGGLGLYGRSRAWPNKMSSLVYSPNLGIHATD